MNRIIDALAAALAVRLVPLIRKAIEMNQQQLDALTAQVAANTSVVESTLTLIRGLRAQLEAIPSGSQQVTDIIARLKASDEALAAAVAANTPVDPSTAPAPGTADPGAPTT